MIQKILGRTVIPSPFTRGYWVFTLACGHLHGIRLEEPEASKARSEWDERFRLPRGEAGPAIQEWFDETNLMPKEVDCKTCDSPVDYSKFDFFAEPS